MMCQYCGDMLHDPKNDIFFDHNEEHQCVPKLKYENYELKRELAIRRQAYSGTISSLKQSLDIEINRALKVHDRARGKNDIVGKYWYAVIRLYGSTMGSLIENTVSKRRKEAITKFLDVPYESDVKEKWRAAKKDGFACVKVTVRRYKL